MPDRAWSKFQAANDDAFPVRGHPSGFVDVFDSVNIWARQEAAASRLAAAATLHSQWGDYFAAEERQRG